MVHSECSPKDGETQSRFTFVFGFCVGFIFVVEYRVVLCLETLYHVLMCYPVWASQVCSVYAQE